MTTKTEAQVRKDLAKRGRTRMRTCIPGNFERGRTDHRPVVVSESDLAGCDKCPICKIGRIVDTGGKSMRVCEYCGQRYSVGTQGGK